MATIQCKMCGGTMDLPQGKTSGECPYCGCLTTYPKVADPHREQLYNRAEHFRRLNDFDKAVDAYEALVREDDSDPEAYWGLVLSRYGIEYVEDPATHERIPTCHRVQFESILADADYQTVLEKSSGTERDIYEKEAQRIAEIQKGILAISAQEKPFDVFICYKEATDGGTRTKDSVIAQDIYYQLVNSGYKVFFARITLEDKLGQQYEPYIFAALNSAKVMLVIGTKKEYFETVWVRNEWSRFLALMKKDRKKLLIPCYK
ncbi:MAG: TIR domain-containing protein, partial [Lentisphaeria bacterium]|nr:TIR domain-containing protein [Lentisphaeria bacterium]